MAARKILVTGGAGFIGSHITESLVKSGWAVTVYDNFSSGRREYLASVSKDVRIVEGDILDTKSVARALKGCSVLSHQAAQLEIFRCLEDPLIDLRTNTGGTLSVLEAAKSSGVRRVLHASSACVYGQAQQQPESEEHPLEPNWPYGVSKVAAERYGRLYSRLHGMEVVDLRYGIVYGPREWLGRVLTCFLKRVLEGKPPVIFGNGDQKRDFIYVDDVVSLHNLLLERDTWTHPCYNAGTGIGTDVRTLADLVIRVCGREFKPIFEDTPEGTASRNMPERRRIPHELKVMILDPARARTLGWQPRTGLEEGVKKEFDWMRSHRDHWENKASIAV